MSYYFNRYTCVASNGVGKEDRKTSELVRTILSICNNHFSLKKNIKKKRDQVVATATSLNQSETQTLEREAGQPVTLHCQVVSSLILFFFLINVSVDIIFASGF